jgi:serine protease Do
MFTTCRQVVATILLAALACTGCQPGHPLWPAEPVAAASSITDTTPVIRGSIAAFPDFSALVEQCGGAVVNVSASEFPVRRRVPAPIKPTDPYYDFLRRYGIPAPPLHEPRVLTGSNGSGVIVSPDGYILTNAHVVSEAGEVTVKLLDRREFSAEVVGADALSDLAVLKIEGKDLPVARLGDAGKLKAGQWVIAIGSPFEFENSVTAGVVGGNARALPDKDYLPFVQTDVAIDAGNSGGPLFNLQGEVVGINSMIHGPSDSSPRLSFAIPIDVAHSVEQQLIKTGHVRRGRIGVTVRELNAQFAESLGLPCARGALVSFVETGGPADKAGLKPGDVVLRVNGQILEHSNRLPALIAGLAPGGSATLHVWRKRAEVEIEVGIDELKERRIPVAITQSADGQGPAGRDQ